MFDMQEHPQSLDTNQQVQEVIEQGNQYAAAFRFIDPRLNSLNSESDKAIAFDVGQGAEGVAFGALGFNLITVTNAPSALYLYAYPGRSSLENEVYGKVAPYFPKNTYRSNLGVSDWLDNQKFSPRLTTMLRIAPGYFEDEETALDFFLEFVKLHERLKSPSTIILSALDDHPSSLRIFQKLSAELNSQSIQHQLLVDESIPPELQVLGQRILTLIK